MQLGEVESKQGRQLATATDGRSSTLWHGEVTSASEQEGVRTMWLQGSPSRERHPVSSGERRRSLGELQGRARRWGEGRTTALRQMPGCPTQELAASDGWRG